MPLANFEITLIYPSFLRFLVLSYTATFEATLTQDLLHWISTLVLLVANQTNTKMLHCFKTLFPFPQLL